MNEELLLVNSRNFEINQLLVKIFEEKDAPYVEDISQVMDTKFSVVIPKSTPLWM